MTAIAALSGQERIEIDAVQHKRHGAFGRAVREGQPAVGGRAEGAGVAVQDEVKQEAQGSALLVKEQATSSGSSGSSEPYTAPAARERAGPAMSRKRNTASNGSYGATTAALTSATP